MLRLLLIPKRFDSLLARSLTLREKAGWALLLAVAVFAIAFSGRHG